MSLRALLAASVLALAACDDFDDLLCKRVGCDGGVDGGAPDAGADAGVDAGADAGVDAGGDAGFDAGADALRFDALGFLPTLSDRVRINGFIAGWGFTVLAADGLDAQLTLIASRQTSAIVPAYRPAALGLWNNTVLLGGDGGVELWDSTSTTAVGHLAAAPPLSIACVTGYAGGVFAVGVDSAGNLAWSALQSADGGGPTSVVSCRTSSLAATSTGNGGAHYVLGAGSGAGCTAGSGGDLFFGRWLPGQVSLAVPRTGAHLVPGTGVHAATDNATAMFAWQDDAGLRLARATTGATSLEVAAAPVLPLGGAAPVESDLTLYNNGDFVLVVDATQATQSLQLPDGGVYALELGVPVLATGTWGAVGDPAILRLRALRPGHWVVSPHLAHSVSDDEVYFGGLCQGSAGPARAPCEGAGPGYFIVHVLRE